MSEIKKYEPLSKPFQNAGLAANQSGPGVFRTWFVRGGGNDLNDSLIDEGAAFEIVERLLAPSALSSFLFLPPPVAELQTAYEAIREEREAYLRYVLSVQREEILRTLKRFEEQRIRKRIGGLTRGIARRRVEHDHIRREMVNKTVDVLDRTIDSGVRRAERGTSIRVASIVEATLLPDAMERATVDIRRRLITIIREIRALIERRAILEIELEEQEETRDLLEGTNARLATLGGPLDLSPAPEPVVSVSTSTSEPSPTLRRFGKIKTRGVATVVVTTNTDAGADIDTGIEMPEDYVDRSLRLVRETVEAANAGGRTRIRVLIWGARIGSHATKQRNWEELIRNLGFEGRVECVDYEKLDATSDTDSPVVVPSRAYAHFNKWSPRRFSALCVLSINSAGPLIERLASSHSLDTSDT